MSSTRRISVSSHVLHDHIDSSAVPGRFVKRREKSRPFFKIKKEVFFFRTGFNLQSVLCEDKSPFEVFFTLTLYIFQKIPRT